LQEVSGVSFLNAKRCNGFHGDLCPQNHLLKQSEAEIGGKPYGALELRYCLAAAG
jgi:hypothetical protein